MAISKRKFYKNVFIVVVLSEEPIASCPDLSVVAHQITEGDWNGDVTHSVENEEIDAKKAVELLEESGSDAGFFNLNEKGENADGSEDDEEGSEDG